MDTVKDRLPALRLRALRLLKNNFLRLRAEGKSSEEAIDTALTLVKDVYLGLHGEPGVLPSDKKLNAEERHWLWNQIFEVLVEVQLILPNAYSHVPTKIEALATETLAKKVDNISEKAHEVAEEIRQAPLDQ